jgi:Zn ribbon nucleic-acid-binding protein
MNKSCRQCGLNYEITIEDLDFYNKITPVFDDKKYHVPPPTLCPDCRDQRRLAFRNERSLYQRKCDLCGDSIISVYHPDSDLVVYCPDCWWSDKWDATEYGKDFDFTRPFFEQLSSLLKKVPLLANNVWNSVNCEYNSFCVNSKDCYMSQRVGDDENVLYSYCPLNCIGCMDCYVVSRCQYCYECMDCWNCYNTYYSEQCKTTSDSAFCFDCIGCKNCFCCFGLRNCEYYFFNRKCTKEEYKQNLKDYYLGSRKNIKKIWGEYLAELLKRPRRAAVILNSQNACGDNIVESKDIFKCFNVEKSETTRNSWGVEFSKDICDSDFIHYGEICYENMSNSKSGNIFFSAVAIEGVSDLWYSMYCVNGTHDSFGSVSLKKQEYCILNKKYSREEYGKMVSKIIEHMIKSGEYGEFFPVGSSPFAYNESVAQEYYPLSEKQVLEKDWRWKEENTKQYLPQTFIIPDDIKDVPDTVLNELLACVDCKKNYKIVPQELKFYRSKNLAISGKCPDCRYKDRMTLRNPRKLFDRKCAKCSAEIQTTFAPDRPEIVYCEKCYLKEVY